MTVAFSTTINAPSLGSAENDENGETHQKGTPMRLEVSKVTTVSTAISSDEFKKALELIKQSGEVIEKTGKSAADFYKDHKDVFEKIEGGFKVIEGLGKILGGVAKFLPDAENEMVQKLAGLEKEVKQLGETLNKNFGEMKAFISEHAFFSKIVSPTAVLTKLMRDCLKSPGDDTKANFQKVYHENFPLKLQYILKSYLKHTTTNPLKMNMNAEKAKTKKTFDKWEDIICRVMIQFIILEAFANGLLGLTDNTNMERQILQSIEIFSEMHSWREEYNKNADPAYWEEFKKFLVPYMESKTRLSKSQKADEIKAKLDSYFTSDAFYIVVMNETTWHKDYTYKFRESSVENHHIAGSWGKGGCHAFVYRSTTKKDQGDYDNLKGYVGKIKEKNDWAYELNDIVNQIDNGFKLAPYTFCCLMAPECHPEVRYLNHIEGNKGPGDYDDFLRPVKRWQHEDYYREVYMILAFA